MRPLICRFIRKLSPKLLDILINHGEKAPKYVYSEQKFFTFAGA